MNGQQGPLCIHFAEQPWRPGRLQVLNCQSPACKPRLEQVAASAVFCSRNLPSDQNNAPFPPSNLLSIQLQGDCNCLPQSSRHIETTSNMFRNALRQSTRAVGAISATSRVAAVSLPHERHDQHRHHHHRPQSFPPDRLGPRPIEIHFQPTRTRARRTWQAQLAPLRPFGRGARAGLSFPSLRGFVVGLAGARFGPVGGHASLCFGNSQRAGQHSTGHSTASITTLPHHTISRSSNRS